jgi:hypothetical protein
MKPEVFIGSSAEAVLYAYGLQHLLEAKADVTVWNQGTFTLNANYLDALLKALKATDFGIFIFSPDDLTTVRDETHRAVRDNVLFEFGMFLGGLGPNRSFFLLPNDLRDFRLPSDLLGISTTTFDAHRTPLAAALGPACFKILQAIETYGVRQERFTTPTVETIRNPRFLCTCSPHFFTPAFENDVQVIKSEMQKLSDSITVSHDISSQRLKELMRDNLFDIIHVVAYVAPKTGDLYFNEVKRGGVFPEGAEIDSLPASQFAKLVELSKARLVTVATCDSLILGAKLAKITNMIAATDWVDVKDLLEWELFFYNSLSKGISIANAFETAASLSKAPMLLLTKKDVAFTR